MTRKTWAVLSLALLLSALLGIIGCVVLIDPFEIYHQAFMHIPPITNGTQNYSNAGIAKSYEYDSVIIGSSMTENFRPSQLDELLGGRFVKLPINAGSPFNHKQMMDMAFGTHDVKRVFYGIDIELMTYFYKTPKCEMPDYLYDDNLFNDVQYWFNRSVLAKYIPSCLKTLGQHDPAFRDTMYTWGHMYDYGKKAALANIVISDEVFEQEAQPEVPVLSQQTRLNVEHNILPFIQDHPDTEFIFFFPPYSVAKWYEFYRLGQLEYHLGQKVAVAEALLSYENVKVFDFQAETAWITNLDNYIDSSHYGPWINDEIVMAVSEDRKRITDAAQLNENNGVIRSLVNQVIAAGKWPDSFTL